MEFIVLPITALIVSLITLFSGFGLGTILLPVFAIFFPLNISITLTALIHFINNIFKVIILGRYANTNIIIRFGIPALISAFIGAWILKYISDINPILTYSINTNAYSVTTLKIVIGILIIIFALVELIPKFQELQFNEKYLPIGGLLSGLLGGVSGHQGALRSLFLTRCNLSKESFIGTGVVIACLVDISRLIAYNSFFFSNLSNTDISLLILTIVSSVAGVLIGNKLLQKTTYKSFQKIVGSILIIFGILLIAGII